MKFKAITYILAASLLIAGCSGKEETKPKPKSGEPAETAKKEKTEAEKEFSDTYPLTGIGTNETKGRSVAVMVNNHPNARPQSGLSKADVVYEMLTESEVTRFLAVFQSEKPEKVGPVRSARDYYIELAKGLGALYIAHGYSPEAKTLLSQGYVDNLNGIAYDGTLFKRETFRRAPHNSYISFENIEKGAAQKSYDLDSPPEPMMFLTKDGIEGLQGNPASTARIKYGSEMFNVQYEYDEALGKYKRFSNGEQTVEYGGETPILLDNLFIIEAPHHMIDNGRRDIDITTGGIGYLLQKGKINEVEWQNKNGRIIPMKSGVEIGLVPGKTWVNIVPGQPGISQSVTIESK
ncbi:DUF3048 domain-containing protein [Peribacillus glennii]|uniref:DUF3048 domain-containing protein n=1 Tax=Peribacillus glennii TaxID=2303991 RepID=A0A372L8R6_9BACI|nr:DUF3048 domain-containing protein [Peribacillus glennii]RFU61860.1 DUF3048 domain-containing protein [Peribacillus glennii]